MDFLALGALRGCVSEVDFWVCASMGADGGGGCNIGPGLNRHGRRLTAVAGTAVRSTPCVVLQAAADAASRGVCPKAV